LYGKVLNRCAFYIVLAVLTTGCVVPTAPSVGQPAATPAAADTPLPAATQATGRSISGQVLWGQKPVPQAQVELRTPGWVVTQDPALASTVADVTGHYVLENPPVGDYTLVGIFPDGEPDQGGWTPVVISAGEALTGTNVILERELRLLEPTSGAEEIATPTLRWESFPGVTRYRVWVVDAGTTELVIDHVTEETSLAVESPLKAGQTYTWVVNGIDAVGTTLASLTSEFRVKP
jgi:hypothetical protein